MDNSKDQIYKIKHISKIYGHRYVLNDVAFEVNKGEILGIIGTSGSGKSTLLNSLVGFIKVEKGDIKFRNVNMLNAEDEDSFRSIYKHQSELKKIYGFGPQNTSFYPNLTVKENLYYFASLYNISKESTKSNINYLLNLVGLTQSQHIISRKLSGGMKRRLDIACSLIHDPKILILDEPTADLDPVISGKIWNLLKIINQRGTTIIIASHHIADIEQLCDRVIILREGRVVSVGNPDDIKAKNIPNESINLKSSPGNYEKIIKALKNKFGKEIKSYDIKNKSLIIDTVKPREIVHEILKITEELKEKIIDLELIRPTLDKVFIMMNEDSLAEKKKEDKKFEVKKKNISNMLKKTKEKKELTKKQIEAIENKVKESETKHKNETT